MKKIASILFFFYSLSANAQWNFWHGFLNSCKKPRANCMEHFLAGCRENGTYRVTTGSGNAQCNMTTNGGGWQKKDVASVDIAKIKQSKQYIVYLSVLSTKPAGAVPNNTEISGIMKNGDPTNYIVAKGVTTFPKTTNASTAGGDGNQIFNYISAHYWFQNNNFTEIGAGQGNLFRTVAPPFDFLVFENKFVGYITLITNGQPPSEHAYSYYWSINYEVWEKP